MVFLPRDAVGNCRLGSGRSIRCNPRATLLPRLFLCFRSDLALFWFFLGIGVQRLFFGSLCLWRCLDWGFTVYFELNVGQFIDWDLPSVLPLFRCSVHFFAGVAFYGAFPWVECDGEEEVRRIVYVGAVVAGFVRRSFVEERVMAVEPTTTWFVRHGGRDKLACLVAVRAVFTVPCKTSDRGCLRRQVCFSRFRRRAFPFDSGFLCHGGLSNGGTIKLFITVSCRRNPFLRPVDGYDPPDGGRPVGLEGSN